MRSKNKLVFRSTVALFAFFAFFALSTSCYAIDADDGCLRSTAELLNDVRQLEVNYAQLRADEVKGEKIRVASTKAKVRNNINDVRSSYQQTLADCKP